MLINYGLEFFEEDNQDMMALIGYVIDKSEEVLGYYQLPYLHARMGDVEFWASTNRDSEEKLLIKDFNSHSSGPIGWNVIYTGIDITPEQDSKFKKTLMVENKEKKGLLPITILNYDILPGLLKGDEFSVQVIAQPLQISYYATEEEYLRAQQKSSKGEKWAIAVGSLIAANFVVNHEESSYVPGKKYDNDDVVMFTATVTHLYHGKFQMGDTKDNTFIRCFANTQYGEMEFVHSIEQIPKNQQKNIKIGSIISGTCVISGDVALYEYTNGIVYDKEHTLKLLRYTLVKGDAQRLRSVLSETATYKSINIGSPQLVGPDEIIDKINSVHVNSTKKFHAFFAHITQSNENLKYPVGTRCIVLARGDKKNYDSIVFVEMNDYGVISSIELSRDSGYEFRLDANDND